MESLKMGIKNTNLMRKVEGAFACNGRDWDLKTEKN